MRTEFRGHTVHTHNVPGCRGVWMADVYGPDGVRLPDDLGRYDREIQALGRAKRRVDGILATAEAKR